MEKLKTPSFSTVYKTEVVFPNDTNPMGILQGGRLVQWMDIAAAVSAQTHAGKICVTASMDAVSFNRQAHVGDILTIQAKVTRAFTTSMEVIVRAWSKSVFSKKRYLISESYFTFVALDVNGKPSEVNSLHPVSTFERMEYLAAHKRRSKKG